MVPFNERRHRISSNEVPWVRLAIENELKTLIETEFITPQIEHLFRLWWRIMRHREGRPDYPDPLTLKIIRKHITGDEMVPKNNVGENPYS